MAQKLYVISNGAFYRPVDTPAGKAGWVGEITFWYSNLYEGERLPNIQKVFTTQKEAESFVRAELYKLCNNPEYKVRGFKRFCVLGVE